MPVRFGVCREISIMELGAFQLKKKQIILILNKRHYFGGPYS